VIQSQPVLQNTKTFTWYVLISGFYRQHTSITGNDMALVKLIPFHLMSEYQKNSFDGKVIRAFPLQTV